MSPLSAIDSGTRALELRTPAAGGGMLARMALPPICRALLLAFALGCSACESASSTVEKSNAEPSVPPNDSSAESDAGAPAQNDASTADASSGQDASSGADASLDAGAPDLRPVFEWCVEPNPEYRDCGVVTHDVTTAEQAVAARQCMREAIENQQAFRLAHGRGPPKDIWYNVVYVSNGAGAPTLKVAVTGVDAQCGFAMIRECAALTFHERCVVRGSDLCVTCEGETSGGECWADCPR